MPSPLHLVATRRALGLLACGLLAGNASGATVRFQQNATNDATGAVIDAVASDQLLETAFSYPTVAAPSTWDYPELRFTHWTVTGSSPAAYRDAWGRSLDSVSLVLLEHTTATAHYLPVDLDADSDGLPDWSEIAYFGSLAHTGAGDFDADGRDNQAEHAAASHPLFPDHSQAGGIAKADTPLLTCNFASYATYTLSSDPEGLVNESATVVSDTVVATPDFADHSDFAHWLLDGVRQQDAWGRALSAVTFVMASADRTAVAIFLAGDSDSDAVPDAWEQRHLGTLAQDAASDSDADGRTLLDEYLAGSNPAFVNTLQAGGISHADSASVTVNFAGFKHYSLTSDPAGLVAQSATVTPGTHVVSPDLADDSFAHWTLDGERQQDGWGVALRQISFTVTDTDRTGVATFLVGDGDADGLPDAWEQYYLGQLGLDGAADTDGDGLALAQEYATGGNPRLGNHTQAGGVRYADSAPVLVNLQFFDRLRHVLVGGVLSELFSSDPRFVSGWDFGPRSAPAAGDWNGDGLPDLFVVSSNALCVLENAGSAATPDYQIASSAAFADLAALCAGITRPALALGDWTADGRADLVLGGSTHLLRGFVASGNFSSGQPAAVAFTLDTGGPLSIPALGDADGDGRLDLLVLIADGSVRAYLNNGDTLAPFSGVPVANWLPVPVPGATSLACADVTGDGVADVVVADAEGRVWEFHRSGSAYLLKSKVWAGTGPGFADGLALALVDLNGDGYIDALGGTAQGGLVALRDPRIGAPTGLAIKRGGHSLALSWDPNQQSRIRGYLLYRRTDEQADFTPLTSEPLPANRYLDEGLAHGATYHYRVTSFAASYLPGNSVPKFVESPPSASASQTLGKTKLTLYPKYQPGRGRLRVQLSVESTRELLGEGLEFTLRYNPAVLTPITQVDADEPTVKKSGLAKKLTIEDDGATANGELHIRSTGGELSNGQGMLLEIVFAVSPTAPAGAAHQLELIVAALQDIEGNTLAAELPACEPALLDSVSVLGDLNGDGTTDDDDVERLSDLVKDKDATPTAAELDAGDLNGDGALDQSDLILLRRELAGKKNTA